MIPCPIDLSSRSFFDFLEAIGAFDVLKVPFVFDQLADSFCVADLVDREGVRIKVIVYAWRIFGNY